MSLVPKDLGTGFTVDGYHRLFVVGGFVKRVYKKESETPTTHLKDRGVRPVATSTKGKEGRY